MKTNGACGGQGASGNSGQRAVSTKGSSHGGSGLTGGSKSLSDGQTMSDVTYQYITGDGEVACESHIKFENWFERSYRAGLPEDIKTAMCVGFKAALYFDKIERAAQAAKPIPMILFCPSCGEQHIDEGEWATKLHKTHLCQHCECEWRPANVATVGVETIDVTRIGN